MTITISLARTSRSCVILFASTGCAHRLQACTPRTSVCNQIANAIEGPQLEDSMCVLAEFTAPHHLVKSSEATLEAHLLGKDLKAAR